jgi:prevent-host-death family protein
MKIIAASKFKIKCLSLIRDIVQDHEPVIITKHGKPLAKLVPYKIDKEKENKPLKGAATYIGDIVSPIDVKWESME